MSDTKSPKPKAVDLKELTADTVKLEHLSLFPTMTGWFNPKLLGKLLLNLIVADLFGQYADRRLIEAALDPDKTGKTFTISPTGRSDGQSIWIDFVANLGDGFDATYAVAYLLAQPSLTIGDLTLPREAAVFFGGDQVYPTASRDDYIIKLRKPYEFARPQVDNDQSSPPVFALPGNHDWYDGLVVFLAMFCREKRTRYGNWGSTQRRSYFSVKLAEKWWLWGIDIALIRDMDQPQADYFVHVAANIPDGSNIIVCSAEPGWYVAAANGDAYRTPGYASSLARKADRKLQIPLVLSGDTHHYARYFGADTHFVTSGGGGAYLNGTAALWLIPTFLPQAQWHWFFWALALLLTVPVEAAIAGTIFGLNLYLTCRFFGRNNNDAFSSMRLDSHRHFLRIHIEGDKLTLYPICIDRVPPGETSGD